MNKTEVVFVLDRSGSMEGLEKDTIGGFNSMLEKQKKEEGEAIISTILFDHRIEVLHDRLDINDVKPITEEEYQVCGSTSLLDAIGHTVKHIKGVHKEMKKSERPDKTIFIITTDGYENSSRDYSYEKVKKLVEKQQEKKGWEFLFLGANIDAIDVASSVGIRKNRAVNYNCDSEGLAVTYDGAAGMISAMRNADADDDMDEIIEEYCAPIRADYEKRGIH